MSRYFYTEDDNGREVVDGQKVLRVIRNATLGTVGVFLTIWLAVGIVSPQIHLYKARTEKKALIAEAQAHANAAKYEADRSIAIAKANAQADRERAKGIRDAQATIAESLTPEYIRWYSIDQLMDNPKGQLIYVPIGPDGQPFPLPTTENGRAVNR